MLRKLVRSRAASRLQASLSDSLLGQILYIGYAIYIYIVCNYSQPVAAAVATDIYIYTYTYIYIYSFDFIIRSHFCSSDPRIKPFVLWGPLILKTLSGVALAIAAEGAG